jgi:hypothetical protein
MQGVPRPAPHRSGQQVRSSEPLSELQPTAMKNVPAPSPQQTELPVSLVDRSSHRLKQLPPSDVPHQSSHPSRDRTLPGVDRFQDYEPSNARPATHEASPALERPLHHRPVEPRHKPSDATQLFEERLRGPPSHC